MEMFIKLEPTENITIDERNVQQGCCLCLDGVFIQQELIKHLRERHSKGEKFYSKYLSIVKTPFKKFYFRCI